MTNARKSRFAFRLDMVFWFIVLLLPIACYLVVSFRNADAVSFFAFMAEFSPFTFVQNILDDVLQTAFGSTFALTSYLGYCVGVELLHVLFDVIVFIPRLAHKWISKAVQDD